jgi:hypothetical protein
MSLFVMLMMVRINYYIATVWPKARYLLGDEGGEKVNHLFDVVLPRTLPKALSLIYCWWDRINANCWNSTG